MTRLLADLDAFLQEHRRCGSLDGDVEGRRGWMARECGAVIVHDGSATRPGAEAAP